MELSAEDTIVEILRSKPDSGVKGVLKELQLLGLDVSTKEVRTILSRLKAEIREECLAQQGCAKSQPSVLVCQHLDNVICSLMKSPHKVIRNFQALTHVFNGVMGLYELNHDSISWLVSCHPLYRGGNAENTPLYSCKFAVTLVMLLCAELNIENLKTTSSFLTHSSGVLRNVGALPPNQGVLMAAVESAKNDILQDRECRVLGVSMTDLHVFQALDQQRSIAHAFVLALSVDTNDGICATLYQAFGPPRIGYELSSWCLGKKSPRYLSSEKFAEFVVMYESFASQHTWDRQSEALYQSLFACKMRMRHGYPISTHTRILVAKPTISSIDTMMSYIIIE